MFNLNDIIQNAQNGKAIDNLAQQFGITPEQAQAAVQAIIPALSAGLMQKLGQPGALGSIISAVTDSTHQASFSNPEAAQSTATTQKGTDIINDIFGSNHIVQQIAAQVSKVTGLRADLIMQMFPVIASIAMGGIAAAAQKQGWGGMLGQLANAARGEQSASGTTAQTAPGQTASTQSSSGGIIGALIGMAGAIFGASTHRTARLPLAPPAIKAHSTIWARCFSRDRFPPKNDRIRPARRDRQDSHGKPFLILMRGRRCRAKCEEGKRVLAPLPSAQTGVDAVELGLEGEAYLERAGDDGDRNQPGDPSRIRSPLRLASSIEIV